MCRAILNSISTSLSFSLRLPCCCPLADGNQTDKRSNRDGDAEIGEDATKIVSRQRCERFIEQSFESSSMKMTESMLTRPERPAGSDCLDDYHSFLFGDGTLPELP